MRKEAEESLPAGHTLELTIVDIKRAGWGTSPARGEHAGRADHPRHLPAAYDPALPRTDASGTLVAEGEKKLSDPAFLMNASPLNDSDPLRYEKRMVDSRLRSDSRGTAAR